MITAKAQRTARRAREREAPARPRATLGDDGACAARSMQSGRLVRRALAGKLNNEVEQQS
jgi:hypothetical protein